MDLELSFRDRLIEKGFLLPLGIKGVYGRREPFERIVRAIEHWVEQAALSDGAEPVFFPPVLPRETLRRAGYMENFPQLCGSIHSFMGDDAAHRTLLSRVEEGSDWGPSLAQTELTLCPAACYGLYPTLSGSVPAGGRLFSLSSFVFRHEPSDDLARLQIFRMRESVCVGSPERVAAWREVWLKRSNAFLAELDLDAEQDVANDPFFGRGGRVMVSGQRDQELKFELLAPVSSAEKRNAVASFNYHRDHYTKTFGIELDDGNIAHTGCIGFGLERMTLALLLRHGLNPGDWPPAVRRALWP